MQPLAEAYLAHCTACAENMREVSPKFLVTLTSAADCVSLLPTAYTVLGWEYKSGQGMQKSEQLGLQS